VSDEELRDQLLVTRSVLAAVIGYLDESQKASILRVLRSAPGKPNLEGLSDAALNEFVNLRRWIVEGAVPGVLGGLV